jgi:hypothetical protein
MPAGRSLDSFIHSNDFALTGQMARGFFSQPIDEAIVLDRDILPLK